MKLSTAGYDVLQMDAVQLQLQSERQELHKQAEQEKQRLHQQVHSKWDCLDCQWVLGSIFI